MYSGGAPCGWLQLVGEVSRGSQLKIGFPRSGEAEKGEKPVREDRSVDAGGNAQWSEGGTKRVLERVEDLLGGELKPCWGESWGLDWVDISFWSLWVDKEVNPNSNHIPTMRQAWYQMLSIWSHWTPYILRLTGWSSFYKRENWDSR